VDQLRRDGVAAALEHDRDRHHLGDEIPVAETSSPDGSASGRVDLDPDGAHVGLEEDRFLDRPGQPRGGAFAHWGTQVLVEYSPELDPGLEQECFPVGERGAMEVGGSVGHGGDPPAGAAWAFRTVKGPSR
jgi:hypothetical protein